MRKIGIFALSEKQGGYGEVFLFRFENQLTKGEIADIIEMQFELPSEVNEQ